MKKIKIFNLFISILFPLKFSWNFFYKNYPAYEIRTYNLHNDAPCDLQLTHAFQSTTHISTKWFFPNLLPISTKLDTSIKFPNILEISSSILIKFRKIITWRWLNQLKYKICTYSFERSLNDDKGFSFKSKLIIMFTFRVI